MTAPDPRIVRLAGLADMLRDAELSKLKALTDRRKRLEQAHADLDRDRIAAMGSLKVDPARLIGADIRWQGWAAARMQALSLDIARAAAEAEAQKTRAAQALGRAQVLTELSKGGGAT